MNLDTWSLYDETYCGSYKSALQIYYNMTHLICPMNAVRFPYRVNIKKDTFLWTYFTFFPMIAWVSTLHLNNDNNYCPMTPIFPDVFTTPTYNMGFMKHWEENIIY